MERTILKLNSDQLSVLQSLNEVHENKKIEAFNIDGQSDYFINYDTLELNEFSQDFINFFSTLEKVNINTQNLKNYNMSNINVFKTGNIKIRPTYDLYGEENYPETLYHYTDYSGLLGIVNTKQIWATHYSYLNDKNEFEYAKELLKDRIVQLFKEKNSDLVDGFDIHFSTLFYSYDIFLFSFTTEYDRLSQWRGYSNNGNGFCLGFKTSKIGLTTPPQIINYRYSIFPVLYDYNKQIEIIDNIIISCYEIPNMNLSNTSFISTFYQNLFDKIMTSLVTFKSPKFEEEKEWRLIQAQLIPKVINYEKNIKYRLSNNFITPYIELDINSRVGVNQKFPLNKITIGPSIISVLTTKSIEMLLWSNDLENIEILQSEINLR